ncbi:eukaryotic-like serine/threonine-protein kinase [Desulfosarcina sp. BuS5]|uniref:serine/threonine protein kinase n=1 Tax=Desulfosarcina sp. BuS5 TaxID=933262 RepID=UPI0006863F10|nr:serine/threonine-protein kinase [Desulfosarcina sp. BuS5]WDN90694.1 eukaryotic-like serine/threonine-protein kinase [Desulfosarcina sp. BuS5]
MDYMFAQSLSLLFYIITLVIYNRARKEYAGGKIAAAINLVMIFIGLVFLSDFTDYFFIRIFHFTDDTVLIIKLMLKLAALSVLFFGGLRFFVDAPDAAGAAVELNGLSQNSGKPARTGGAYQGNFSDPETPGPKNNSQEIKTIGRYEIIKQTGRGAMGIVYKGRDPRLNRLTAIKTIRFIDDFDKIRVINAKKQFYREAEVIAKLSHPNIVAIYDVGEDKGLSYLAMEYLEGESLEKYTNKNNLLSITKCIDIIIQACNALEYAHNHDIVHRDIKPANIMLVEDGLVKVTDFGIARITASSNYNSGTHTGIIKGTPYYMSPEQTKGMKLTGPSDIFSIGVVFYQLLTGRLPFTGDNPAAIMYQINNVDPEPPSSYNSSIDEVILTILNKTLEKNLQKRYQTAGQMRNHLRLAARRINRP